MSRICILQTSALPEKAEASLDSLFEVVALPPPGPERTSLLAERGPEIRGIAGAGNSPVDGALLDTLPNLEIISSITAGLDAIDTDAAGARGITVTNTSEALADEVADLAVWLLTGITRRLVVADGFVRAGKWRQGQFPLTRSVGGLKVGILGLGHIGKAIARRLEIMGAEIAYHGRNAQDVPYRYFPTLEALAGWAEALVVAVPHTPQTDALVNAEILGALGAEGLVVNIARGAVIEEAALITALENGTIAGAGLDVFWDEPNVPDSLIAAGNTIVLPHVGSATTPTRDRMGDAMVGALARHFGLAG